MQVKDLTATHLRFEPSSTVSGLFLLSMFIPAKREDSERPIYKNIDRELLRIPTRVHLRLNDLQRLTDVEDTVALALNQEMFK